MPRIKTTATVRLALWALRIYLLILLALIGLKFARVFTHPKGEPPAAAIGPAGLPASGKNQ